VLGFSERAGTMMELTDRSGLERIRADMEHLCRTIGNRLAGWAGEERAADWMVERLNELGLTNVGKLPFPCRRWRLVKGELEILDVREDLEEGLDPHLACVPVTHAASTPPEGVEGDVVAFEPLDYMKGLRRKDLTGKIGLFHGSYGESAEVFAEMHNSDLAALVFCDTRLQTEWPVANGMGEKFMKLVKKPMAYISLMDAWKLARAGVRRVRLTSIGATEDAGSWNVVGDLPGDNPDGRVIVVCGHLDSVAVGVGADDNASGIAATLECARRLKQVPRTHTFRFVGFGAEEQLSVGSWRYVADQITDIDRVALVFNFDGFAAWRGITEILSTGTPEFDGYIRDVVDSRLAFGSVVPGVSPYQDAYPFATKGIPGAWFSRKTHQDMYWWHHSVHNDLANVSPEQIAWTAESACTILGEIAATDDWPFDKKIAPDLQKEIDKYRRELFE